MSSNQNPEWYKLTKFLKLKGKITTGLTIPYLFGAYKVLGYKIDTISALIDEVRRNKLDKYPVIQKCGTIHQHVIAAENKNIYHKDYIKDIKLRNANEEIDLVISSNTDLGKDDEMIYKNLTQLYIKFVNEGKFSWINKEKNGSPLRRKK